MDYNRFITEIKKYWDLRNKGLKKQANSFLFEFTGSFSKDVSREDEDRIFYQFCHEYLDELKFPEEDGLPFQITELLYNYFCRECIKNKMPQLRWAYQIYGTGFNPDASKYNDASYNVLEQAYMHEQCDQQTVDFYFDEQINNFLWFGQHHFPEDCLITYEDFVNKIKMADKILKEKPVKPSLVEEFEYYVKLYGIYFNWHNNGRQDSFYEVCEMEGLEFNGLPAIYYKK
ncbi:MAG: hypothetical protein HFH68_12570 [Lachnospiraceae bacterium]|nr:hypothetical protein [Lachnospiraceae bacterium]